MRTSLDFIRMENFRSIKMPDKIDISPITILVGKNSAGKSTFARSFPLIRQSAEVKKRAPILWFGDKVDFGSFDDALMRPNSKVSEKEIIFTFGLRIDKDYEKNPYFRRVGNKSGVRLQAEIRLAIQKNGTNGSQASSVCIDMFGYKTEINFEKNNKIEKIKVDDVVWVPDSSFMTYSSYGVVLPTFGIYKKKEDDESQFPEMYAYSLFMDEIKKEFGGGRYVSQNIEILRVINNAPAMNKGELLIYILEKISIFGLFDVSEVRRKSIEKKIEKIEAMVFASKINSMIEMLNSCLKDYYSAVKYIEPLRATAVRYYRKQELAMDEIDSKGENLAMFLDNLGASLLKSFNNWTQEKFGFFAQTKRAGGHVEIVISENGSNDISNLTDIGFGFSQILPVITQIWLSGINRFKDRNSSGCIVIEQPELHLHPAFQAKLADVFAAVASGKGAARSPRLIIETHSNHIVNRLGQLISTGDLNSAAVQILVFDKNDDGITEITRAGFDKDGYLVNWPTGFFEPEV